MRHRNHRNKYMAYADNQDLLRKALITTCKNNIFIYQKWVQILYHHHSLEMKAVLIQNLPAHNCKIYETVSYKHMFFYPEAHNTRVKKKNYYQLEFIQYIIECLKSFIL